MPRGCIPKASLMFTNASQKYRRYITDHLNEQSAIVTECSANIRLYQRCFGEHSPNHRKSIFFIGTAGIYAQNRKASGSIACIIIHSPYAHLVTRFNNRNMRIVKRFKDNMIRIITTCESRCCCLRVNVII